MAVILEKRIIVFVVESIQVHTVFLELIPSVIFTNFTVINLDKQLKEIYRKKNSNWVIDLRKIQLHDKENRDIIRGVCVTHRTFENNIVFVGNRQCLIPAIQQTADLVFQGIDDLMNFFLKGYE